MVAHFVGDYVSLCKIPGRSKARRKIFKERKIDVDLLIRGAVKRSNRGARHAAGRLHGAGEEHEPRFPVLLAGAAKYLMPRVFRISEYHRAEIGELLLAG